MSEVIYKNSCKEPVISQRRLSTYHICGIHKHDDYELYYMLEGSTTYFIADEIFEVNEGNFVIIPKQTYHKTDNANCMNNERILINFNDTNFPALAKAVLDELCCCKLISVPIQKLPALEDIIYKIKNEHNYPKKNSVLMIDSYIIELLTLLSRYKFDYIPPYNSTGKIILSVSDYIKKNYNRDITLELLSKKFVISRCYLSKKFKDITGLGINEFITYIRMTNAEKLLKTTDYSITEIANMCGYNDSNYFTTTFKKIYGLTPLRFSKKFHI